MTNTERNKRLARDWYALSGSARYDEARAYVSDDFEFYPMIDERLEGVDAFIRLESSHMDPQPGFHFELLNVIDEGDYVAVHFIHEGDLPDAVNTFLGLKAEKKHSHHDVMTWLQFNEEGKICKKWAKYNMFYVLRELGVPEIVALDEKMRAAQPQ